MSEHGMQMLEKILVIQSGKVAQKVTTANKNSKSKKSNMVSL